MISVYIAVNDEMIDVRMILVPSEQMIIKVLVIVAAVRIKDIVLIVVGSAMSP